MKKINKLFYSIFAILSFVILLQQPLQGQCNSDPEYLALAALQNANPSSDLNWDLSDCNYCNYDQVFCIGGKVRSLYLNNKNISVIPAEIGNLSKLKNLSLYNNQIESLPNEIGNLINLTSLSLRRNQLTSIPNGIGNLVNLTSLQLNDNQLTSVPNGIGNLVTLTSLQLHENQLTSVPNGIGNLVNLTNLQLYENQLTSVPNGIGNLVKLTSLNLQNNQINSIPTEIGNLINLQSFNLQENQLTSIPAEIGNLINLQSFNLQENQLTSIPAEIGYLTKLTNLALFNNQLTSIPAEIGYLTQLTSLALFNNQLTSIPAEIGYLNKLTNFNLINNQLTSLPPEIGNLNKLTSLFVNNNQLTSLPPEIGNLNKLQFLYANNNQLTELPTEIRYLDDLRFLFVYYNNISCIPIEIKELCNESLILLSAFGNDLPIGFSWNRFCNSSYGACCDKATLSLPSQPTTIHCAEATNYVPQDATYTNGLSGECGQTGETSGEVDPLWNSCTGGFIFVKYGGLDNFGNTMESQSQVINVLADVIAPQGDMNEMEITLPSINDVPEADDLQMYKDEIASHFIDHCNQIKVTMTNDQGEAECSVDGTFEKIYEMEVSDACGNISGIVNLKFAGKCNPLYCTMSQSFYAGKSNPNTVSGLTSYEIIDELMGGGTNPIIIGSGECGFVLENTSCVQQVLEGGGQSISLDSGFELNCNEPMNNALVNQMITTILNIRYNDQMMDLDFGNFHIDAACMNISGSLSEGLPENATINDLIDYANNFISCQCSGTCGEFENVMSELTGIFLGLNSRFNNCNEPGPCQLDENGQSDMVSNSNTNTYSESKFVVTSLPSDLNEIKIYPNPAKEIVFVNAKVFQKKTGTISITNNLGQILIHQNISNPSDEKISFSTQNMNNGFYSIIIQVEGEKPISKPLIIMK